MINKDSILFIERKIIYKNKNLMEWLGKFKKVLHHPLFLYNSIFIYP